MTTTNRPLQPTPKPLKMAMAATAAVATTAGALAPGPETQHVSSLWYVFFLLFLFFI